MTVWRWWWVTSGLVLLGAVSGSRGAWARRGRGGLPTLEGPTEGGGSRAGAPRVDAAAPEAGGPVHEAFQGPVARDDRVRAPKSPPPPMAEEPTNDRPVPQAQWVGGYWAWDPGRNDFVWVAGAWGRPPRHDPGSRPAGCATPTDRIASPASETAPGPHQLSCGLRPSTRSIPDHGRLGPARPAPRRRPPPAPGLQLAAACPRSLRPTRRQPRNWRTLATEPAALIELGLGAQQALMGRPDELGIHSGDTGAATRTQPSRNGKTRSGPPRQCRRCLKPTAAHRRVGAGPARTPRSSSRRPAPKPVATRSPRRSRMPGLRTPRRRLPVFRPRCVVPPRRGLYMVPDPMAASAPYIDGYPIPYRMIRPPGYPYRPTGVVVPDAVPPLVQRLLDRVPALIGGHRAGRLRGRRV